MSLAAGAKTAVAEFYTQRGSYPATNGAAGLATAGDIEGTYVSSVAISGGLITVTYGKDVNATVSGNTMLVSPLTSAGAVAWNCKPGTVPTKYLPTDCRD